jgi:hypothetical protein
MSNRSSKHDRTGLGETIISIDGCWGSALVRSRFGGGWFRTVRKGKRTLLTGPNSFRSTRSVDTLRASSPRYLLSFRCVRQS